MDRFVLAAVLVLGSVLLVGVNAVEHNRTCADSANLTSRGICYMRAGVDADARGETQAAVDDIGLAREADPTNGAYALSQCLWLGKAQQHEAALSACHETLALATSDPGLSRAAQTQISISAEALGEADLLQRSCAALRVSGGELGPACS